MKLEVIYDGTSMKCIREKQVYILKDYLYKLTPSERRNLIGEESWKGQYYNIQIGDTIKFDRSNDYDACFFELEGGAEFKIWCGNPLSFFDESHFKLTNLRGNSCDKRYLKFIEAHPKFNKFLTNN